ncbi:hypothetical protein [Rhodococcus globerulus]|uniref:hypothetical protein n=1 Tax=Rhodococcus globerulus TaxID=33008 RepID=UPI000A48C3E6|nr:hypothetical protein [Rhodococcus globerulus]
MTTQLDSADLDTVAVAATAEQWLSDFADLLRSGVGAEMVLHPDVWWRDLLAFSGDLRSLNGSAPIDAVIASALEQRVHGEHLDPLPHQHWFRHCPDPRSNYCSGSTATSATCGVLPG